jgi:hypothetical protein
MAEILIEQALFHRQGSAMPRLMARSPGFRDDWLHEAEELVTGFGSRPVGVKCPAAVFAYPLGQKHIAVVHVADQQSDPGAGVTAFFLLIVERTAYVRFLGDPFALAREFPPVWGARNDLETRIRPAGPLPRRTVADVRQVLRRVKVNALREDQDPEAEDFERTPDNSESPALLGGAQILVDGGRLVFLREQPDPELMQALWTLLPDSTRSHLWPASFAFANDLGFDAVVVPHYQSEEFEGYTSEHEAANYPQGRYELNLQIAAESGNQADLDALFSRASFKETWRLAVILLVFVSLLVLGSRLFVLPEREAARRTPTDFEKKAALAGATVGVQDPWTALGMIRIGNSLWLEPEAR